MVASGMYIMVTSHPCGHKLSVFMTVNKLAVWLQTACTAVCIVTSCLYSYKLSGWLQAVWLQFVCMATSCIYGYKLHEWFQAACMVKSCLYI